MKKTLHVIVEGLVQGVFFRKFVKENADLLSITGFARNLNDGGVEVTCQGSEPALKKLLEKISIGPKLSRVEKVISREIETTEKFRSFEIRY